MGSLLMWQVSYSHLFQQDNRASGARGPTALIPRRLADWRELSESKVDIRGRRLWLRAPSGQES